MKTTLVKIQNVPLNFAKKFGVHFILFYFILQACTNLISQSNFYFETLGTPKFEV
jgi:hypothetical protein